MTAAGPVRALDSVRRDLTSGIRLLVRAPGFAAAVIATLAMATGGNTAVFAVVNGLLLKPLPVSAPERLGRIDTGPSLTSWLNYEDIRRGTGVFAHVMASRRTATTLDTGGVPVSLGGEVTSTNYFTLIGVPAALGRTYAPSDTRADLVVLSDHVWRSRFGASPSIVGQRITIAGAPIEVIGVMPRAFRGIAPPGLHPDFWAPVDPARSSRSLTDRTLFEFDVVARLAPGVSHEQASAALQTVMAALRRQHPELPDSTERSVVVPVGGLEAFRGMSGVILPVLAFVAVLAILSGLVLLVACANVAGLLVGCATARQREIAVRLALGAGRWRLVRQLLTESFVLAVIGGAAGLLLAQWLVGFANTATGWLPVPIDFDLGIDGRVFAYAFGLSTLACLVFGLAPAWSATRLDVSSSLKQDDAGARGWHRLRRALVAGQVAACTALLIWTGLFVSSLRHIGAVDPGFDPDRVVIAEATLERGAFTEAEAGRIFTEWARQVDASATVETAALAHVVPLALTGREDFRVSLEGDPTGRWVVGNRLTPGWFDTVRIPFVAGRDFTWDDRAGAPEVAIVNDTLARRWFGGRALGQRLVYGTRTLEIVGIVRDSKYATIGETIGPTVYLPFQQVYAFQTTLHARTTDIEGTARRMAEAWERLAPNAPVSVKPMREAVAVARMPARIGAAAVGALGTVVLLLSAIGVYGLVAFVVGQRRREFAIRQALGGTAQHLVGLILRAHARLVIVGVGAGVGTGVLGALALTGFLTGVGPADPLTVAGSIGVILAAVVFASLGPAWRAAHEAPLRSLRDL